MITDAFVIPGDTSAVTKALVPMQLSCANIEQFDKLKICKHHDNLPCNSTNEHVLQVVEAWIDLWAASGTEAAFTAIAINEYEVWTPEWLDLALANYRPLELYPGTHSFEGDFPRCCHYTRPSTDAGSKVVQPREDRASPVMSGSTCP